MLNLIMNCNVYITCLISSSLKVVHNVRKEGIQKVIDFIHKQIHKFRGLCVMIQRRWIL